MIDRDALFAKQFEPFGDGYVFRTRRGGKFVTADEHDKLIADHRRRIRMVESRRLLVATLIAVVVLVAASDYFHLPPRIIAYAPYGIAVVIGCVIAWPTVAPRWYLRGREPVTPPRESSESRRAAREIMPWQMVVGACMASAAILASRLARPRSDLQWWSWTIGSAVFLIAYLWIAYSKWRDRAS